MNQVYNLVPLGKLLTRKKEEINIQELDTYIRITIRMNGQGIVIRDCVSGSKIGTKKQFITKAGQLVLSKIDARNGAFGILPNNCSNAIITGNFWAFDVNHELLDIRYFDYLTKTHLFIDFCIQASDGTTNRLYLQESKFLSMKIPLPPLEEQRRIVARVEKLVEKIEEVRSLRQQALKETEALRISSAKAILAELSHLGKQPLRELVNVQGGGTPSKQNPFFWKGSIPWISPKDMKSRDLNDSIDHISEEATQKSPAKLLEPGSVLIVVRGMILAHTVPSAILRVPAAINQDMKAVLPNEKITPEFLYSVFWTLNDLLLELVEKSTHDTRKLETQKLLNFKIPVPSISEQRRIVAYLDEIQTKVNEMKQLREQGLKELDTLLPSILDKAFKGEL
jgi:type I restriction enzyme S subunit